MQQTPKATYDISRAIVKRYMREFSEVTTPPRLEQGFYAFIIHDTGEVWFNESPNLASVMARYRSKSVNTSKQMPSCIVEARKRGSKIDFFILTRPDIHSAAALENELIEADLMAERKKPVRDGEGHLYVIVHAPTDSYFVQMVRERDVTAETQLGRFLYRLQLTTGGGWNKQIDEFISTNVGDILAGRNFSIHEICRFVNNEDALAKRAEYLENRKGGVCLNFRRASK